MFDFGVPGKWYVQVFAPVSHCKDTYNFDKTNNFSKNICMLLSNLGDFGDNKRQKPNIFLKRGRKVGAGCGSACLPFSVSTGAGLHALHTILLTLAKMNRMPPDAQPFIRLSALCLVRWLEIWFYFAFLERF